ncbi:MAG: lamin tail domain-containing protein [Polyangiales bacterium]
MTGSVGCSDEVESQPPIDDAESETSISGETGADASPEETSTDAGDDTFVEETSTDAPAETAVDAADSAADTETDSGLDSSADADDADAADGASDASDAADSADTADTAPACTVGTDCPGADTECTVRTCDLGVCGVANRPVTTVLTQTAGDCKIRKCDGAGAVTTVADDSDLPDDGNACTQDLCSAGVISHPPTGSGSPCSDGTKTKCDGSGACVECVVASTCPGTDTECNKRSCTAGTCGFAPVGSGTVTSAQVAGDCKVVQCDGSGGTTSANDDTDVEGDGNPCTDDKCSGGIASHLAYPSPHACGGGKICDGTACVECIVATDCTGTDTECEKRTCTTGVCGKSFTGGGTPLAAQTPGDCVVATCDGAGGTTTASAPSDTPTDDGNPCTDEVCGVSGPSHPFTLKDTACSTATVTAGKCDGAGSCVECTSDLDCTGGTECSTASCKVGKCTLDNLPIGTVLATQTKGDCVERQCDGAGHVTSVNADVDVPNDDGNQCTNETCVAGTPSHPNSDPGSTCTQTSGTVCDGSGTCVECLAGTSCTSGVCTAAHNCAAPSCTDLVKNGAETDKDCGGGTCDACALDKTCAVATDCVSGNCVANVCAVNHLVISEVKSRGASGANDEFVEIYNPTAASVTFDNTWTISARSNTASSYGVRYTGTGVVILSHGHLLVAGSSYAGSVTKDGSLSSGITDASSVVLYKSGVAIDAICFGFDAATKTAVTASGYVCEGSPATNPHDNTTSAASNSDKSLERNPNYSDTDANDIDFTISTPSTPLAIASASSP